MIELKKLLNSMEPEKSPTQPPWNGCWPHRGTTLPDQATVDIGFQARGPHGESRLAAADPVVRYRTPWWNRLRLKSG